MRNMISFGLRSECKLEKEVLSTNVLILNKLIQGVQKQIRLLRRTI